MLVPKLDVVSKHVDIQQLPHILLPVIVCSKTCVRRGIFVYELHVKQQVMRVQVPVTCSPVTTFPEANFLRILPISLSTVVFSSSLFLQFLIFEMKTWIGRADSSAVSRTLVDHRQCIKSTSTTRMHEDLVSVQAAEVIHNLRTYM